ncbi:hypothetical protein ACIGDM_01110 [Rothia koreensis]|uniref:hypothetical protein n=1 Tax=Rothia koreensis TaxID=592378 RepID=UPI0037CC5278
MILSELMRRKRAKSSVGWGALEIKYGAPKNAFQRLSVGVKVFPPVDTIERAALFLETSPARVLLAAAEELGVYNPDKDGRLSKATQQHSDEVMWALNGLQEAIRNELNES